MAIDPIQLTKQLVDIESTTYCEGPAGVFLHEYLTAQRYAVERMPVEQPDRACTPGAGNRRALQRLRRAPRRHARRRAFHPHGHRPSILRRQRGRRVPLRPRLLRRKGHHRRADRRRRSPPRSRRQGRPALRRRRGARLSRSRRRQPDLPKDRSSSSTANPPTTASPSPPRAPSASNSAPKAAWPTRPIPSLATPPSTSSSRRSTTSSRMPLPVRARDRPLHSQHRPHLRRPRTQRHLRQSRGAHPHSSRRPVGRDRKNPSPQS